MKKIEVVAAVIMHENQILSVQRPEHKLDYISRKFEFPGGKIEDDETKEEALIRELKEELNLKVNIGKHIITKRNYLNPIFVTPTKNYNEPTNTPLFRIRNKPVSTPISKQIRYPFCLFCNQISRL